MQMNADEKEGLGAGLLPSCILRRATTDGVQLVAVQTSSRIAPTSHSHISLEVSVTHLQKAWPTSVEEEAYWQPIREQYMIAPGEVYLNTGSFGSQPRPVFEKMLKILEDVERNPTRHRAEYNSVVDNSRAHLAAFINAPAEDIAFATNVTMAINMVVHGLDCVRAMRFWLQIRSTVRLTTVCIWLNAAMAWWSSASRFPFLPKALKIF